MRTGILIILATSFLFAPVAMPRVTADDTVWIKRPDGGLSCAPEKAESLNQGSEQLAKAKITVLNSKKAQDGKMRIEMCGAPTGSENSYLIKRSDLPRALVLGFQVTDKTRKAKKN